MLQRRTLLIVFLSAIPILGNHTLKAYSFQNSENDPIELVDRNQASSGADSDGSQRVYQACGARVGEVNSDSAILWTRTTRFSDAKFEKIYSESNNHKQRRLRREMPIDVVPGIAGKVRVYYSADGIEEKSTRQVVTSHNHDFIHQFHLPDLHPNTDYRFRVESLPSENKNQVSPTILQGQFKTAPLESESVPIRFIVSTCQAVRSIDAGKRGHSAYQGMLKFDPDFFVHTGDILYYDKLPLCKSIEQARAKWNLIFAFEHNRNFHLNVASYFMKDDHDTLKNDCWPGQEYGQLTFDDGLRIFREQVPMGQSTYRTIRWCQNLQIWLTENRDFRSANNLPDGPAKTILGSIQKAWLIKSISESNATYKFVISPGPLVGPDKKGKTDNHSNNAFAHEGRELRKFLSSQDNVYVICGDRHWQYCSKDPETGLLEFGCGPINDQHIFGGAPQREPNFHRYFSARGGFLAITIDDSPKAEWYHVESKTSKPRLKILHTETLN